MSEYGTVIETATVRFERLLPGPIERVFAHLTDPELRATWLADGSIDLREGGEVALQFHLRELTPHGEEVPEKFRKDIGYKLRGTVLKFDPPRLLAFTWDASEVCFELAPRGSDVLLTLTHRRLDGVDELRGVAAGWHAHLEVLRDALRAAKPRPYWAHILELERDYEARIKLSQ